MATNCRTSMADPLTVGSFALRIIGSLVKLLGWVRTKIERNSPGKRVPAVGVVLQRYRRTAGQEAGKPATHLMADYLVTNNTDQPLVIVRAEVAYRKGLLRRTVNQMQFQQAIPPGGIGEVRIFFRISPPPFPDERVLKGRVGLIDNLNRLHDGGRLVFQLGFTGPD